MPAEAKYDMTVYPTMGLVRSASDGARTHQVTLASCDCADFINRKGRLIEVDGVMAISVCKHVVEFIERIGGWNRPAEPGPVVYQNVTRQRAFTVLTSSYLASSLADNLLHAAVGCSPLSTGVDITNGQVSVRYDPQTRRYTVSIPGSQPTQMPAHLPA